MHIAGFHWIISWAEFETSISPGGENRQLVWTALTKRSNSVPGEKPGSPFRVIRAKFTNIGGWAKIPDNHGPAKRPGIWYHCDTCNDNDLAEYQCVAKIMPGYHNKNDIAIRSQNNFETQMSHKTSWGQGILNDDFGMRKVEYEIKCRAEAKD